MATSAPPTPGPSPPKAFGALGLPGYRVYLVTFALTMMADNVEHVISYWVVFQKFHSAALGGFAVVSHWLPYLVFSVAVGALNDRFDSRRIIQAGAVLFAIVSAGWGYNTWANQSMSCLTSNRRTTAVRSGWRTP